MTREETGVHPLELSFTLVIEAEAPSGIDGDELAALAAFVLTSERAVGFWEVTVALVDDDRLQELHRDFMGIDTPTDIMTFPSGEGDDEPHGGELVISVDHATTQAGSWGLSPEEEIRFLVTHGLLHLLGWRDDTDEQQRAMLERQQRLFDEWRSGMSDTELG
ncbi:MAG: rRNA maturation RNase YbeY [Chloroflexi bacterium]|nr:rRNA maturation RNase YbeY [Chloroflexota bacterium]